MSNFFYIPEDEELCNNLTISNTNVATNKNDLDIVLDDNGELMDSKKELLDLLGTHFLICNEKIFEKGEDSGFEIYTHDAAIIGVFDGCGGLGSKVCPTISNKTEAYIASRAVNNAVRQWFKYNYTVGYEWDINILKKYIDESLKVCRSCTLESELKLKGSMVRPFPTTMAMITFKITNGKLYTEHFWSGDSRTYVLDGCGISQISVDDIKGEDAMSNLTKDGALTNVISADGKYFIHRAHFEPMYPCIMLCSSDGCFGYVSSPMEFELMILSTLENSNCVNEWQKLLNDEITSRSGDDQTLALAVFGFSSFEEMKNYFCKRHNVILDIVKQFKNASTEEKQLLWERYKTGYYRYEAKEV